MLMYSWCASNSNPVYFREQTKLGPLGKGTPLILENWMNAFSVKKKLSLERIEIRNEFENVCLT